MARISIDALLDNDGTPNEYARSVVASAEIVVAVDVMTEDSLVVDGQQLLEETISGSGTPEMPTVLEVELDMETDELRTLRELVKAIKANPS